MGLRYGTDAGWHTESSGVWLAHGDEKLQHAVCRGMSCGESTHWVHWVQVVEPEELTEPLPRMQAGDGKTWMASAEVRAKATVLQALAGKWCCQQSSWGTTHGSHCWQPSVKLVAESLMPLVPLQWSGQQGGFEGKLMGRPSAVGAA